MYRMGYNYNVITVLYFNKCDNQPWLQILKGPRISERNQKWGDYKQQSTFQQNGLNLQQ